MSTGIERRRSTRHPTLGLVARTDGNAGEYRVVDLSIHGALLEGEQRIAIGTPFDLCLAVPNGQEIQVVATAVRCIERPDGCSIGLRFDAVADEAQDWLHDIIVSELVRSRHRMVLAVAGDIEAAISLWSDLDEVDVDARVVASTEEARSAIYDRQLPISTILIDLREDDGEFLAFVGEVRRAFPSARCLVLTDQVLEIEGIELVPPPTWNRMERAIRFGPERTYQDDVDEAWA